MDFYTYLLHSDTFESRYYFWYFNSIILSCTFKWITWKMHKSVAPKTCMYIYTRLKMKNLIVTSLSYNLALSHPSFSNPSHQKYTTSDFCLNQLILVVCYLTLLFYQVNEPVQVSKYRIHIRFYWVNALLQWIWYYFYRLNTKQFPRPT